MTSASPLTTSGKDGQAPLGLHDLLALDDAEFVRAGYRAMLHRDPDPQGFVGSLDRLAGGLDRRQWLRELRASPEGQLRRGVIDGLDDARPGEDTDDNGLDILWRCDRADFVPYVYAVLLGRPADPAGLAHYNAALMAGTSRERIAVEVASSEEFARRNRVVPGLDAFLQQQRRGLPPMARITAGLARRLRAMAGGRSARQAAVTAPATSARPVAPHTTDLPVQAATVQPALDSSPAQETAEAATDAVSATTDIPVVSRRPARPQPVLASRRPLLSQPLLDARADWPPTARIAAVTIVSKNYLAFARVLARSYLQHHPGHDFIVVLVDRADDLVPLQLDNGARVIETAALRVPDLAQMACRYSIMELNTAVKPYVLDDLFDRGGYERLLYIDPDIQVFQPLAPIHAALDRASVVLTPHLRRPFWDDATPSDTTILQSGSYNLGFVALRRGDTSRRLLDWWKTKLFRDCIVDLPNGLFVDQKWMDLVPGLFPDHAIVHHPGCNAAYWNLHERPITRDGTQWLADGQPLLFFHFSGYLPFAPDVLSKHQNRHRLADLPALKALTDGYAAELMAEDYGTSCRWTYAYGVLPNGVRLPLDLVAQATRLAERVGADLPCPVTEPDAFCRFLMSRGVVPGQDQAVLLVHVLLGLRHDVVAAFPGCQADHDHPGLRAWLATSGVREYVLADLLPFLDAAPPPAPAAEPAPVPLPTVWGGVHRILHLYFLRADLQAEFSDLGSDAGRQAFVAWLRTHRSQLQLPDADIQRFAQWAAGASTLLAQATFLYRHDGRPRALQPGLAALADRRREVNSPLDEAMLADWLGGLPAMDALPAGGVNLAGYLDAPTGMGESGRSMRACLLETGRPLRTVTLPHPRSQPAADAAPADPVLFGWPGEGAAVSISVANADTAGHLRAFLPPGFRAARNVGYWVWETEALPASLARAQEGYDEIWTASRYAAAAIARSVSRPVRVLPHVLDLPAIDRARGDRAAFGLPADGILLGFAFDPQSVLERKNVAGLIEAFEAAFRPDDNCWLVLKVNETGLRSYAFQEALARVRSDRVLVTQQVMDRGQVFDFMRSLDAYVSLHRSEGFGLTCAEAMACGLPVVASGYSGNLDFMDADNSLLVRTRVIETDRPHGPYPAGTRWGDPDAEAAVAAMRSLLSADRRQAIGARGRASVREALSPATVGRQLAALLDDAPTPPAAAPAC